MQKNRDFVVLTDSACDMPEVTRKYYGIEMLNFGIALNGKAYFESEDFTPQEFYDILRNYDNIPLTSQISMQRFLDKMMDIEDSGCRQLLYVSINSSGSGTYNNAMAARDQFYAAQPDSQMEIYIVDSHTYSMAYGWYVAMAVQKLCDGEDMPAVVAWLEDAFSRVEIVLAAYSLKHMKKSGRISAAAAITGDLLGIRPIISLNDGVSEVQNRVRGNQNIHPAMMEYIEEKRTSDFYIVGGTDEDDIVSLANQCEERWGVPPGGIFFLGSAVSSNTGPDAIAIVFTGKKRR